MRSHLGSCGMASLALGICLALSACATPAQETPAANAPPVTALQVSASSWGYIVEQWSLSRDGYGSHAHTEKLRDQLPPASRFAVSASEFDAIIEILKPLEQQLGHGIDCGPMMTDQTRYTVRWGSKGPIGSSLDLYFGCDAPLMIEFGEGLEAAHARVLQLESKGAPGE